jgi:hypothetical protein
VSQRFLREADVAFEFKPEQLSLLEAGQWILASTILERARQETADIEQTVNELKAKWEILGDRYWLRPKVKAAIARKREAEQRRGSAHQRSSSKSQPRSTTGRTQKSKGPDLAT